MHHTNRWILASLLALALTAIPAVGMAQEAHDVVGNWEGFSSRGNFVHFLVADQGEGTHTVAATVIEGGLGGTPGVENYTFTINNIDSVHTQFVVEGELGTLDAYWYGADGLRLHVSPEIVVILTRVTAPEASALLGIEPAAAEEPADTNVEE